MFKDNPVVKKIVETGEERVGKVAQQLLSNEKFVAALQKLVSTSLAAKGTLDKSLRNALSAMNVPSSADVKSLQSSLEQLERRLSSLSEKVSRLEEANRK